MGYISRKVLNIGVLAGMILFLCCLKGAEARIQDPVIALEATSVQLTITIPDNQVANSASYILITHDSGTEKYQSDVVFLMNDGPRVKDAYRNRITVTHTDKRVNIFLSNVSAVDAGNFRCFPGSSTTIIPGCGQLLIILRKPNPPIIKVLPSSSVLVGSNLHLVCETHTTSLPPNHGLTSEIYWYDQTGKNIDSTGSNRRIHVNTDNQLVIENLRHSDEGLKFYCTSADNSGDVAKRIISDPSDVFTVIPEYKPTHEDFRLKPDFDSDEIVRKGIGQQISFSCEALCVPHCDTVWMYRPYGGTAGFGEVTNLVNKRVLTLDMTRINEGSYRCRAENKHGTIYKGFYLEALYITNPMVYIDGQARSSARLLEDIRVDLSCVFDSNPGPIVTWSSPSKATLSSEKAIGPQEKFASNGIYQRIYTSDYSLTHLTCEDSGVYTCDGRNNISAGEGKINLMIMCPPSKASIPGLELLSEYVWDIPQPLTINFLIRALPEPDITRIISSVRGLSRKEEIPRDFVISKSKGHDGKPYLTKFSLTSRRNLDRGDEDRVFTITFESSEFTKDFMFLIRPRGAPREVFNLTARDIGHDTLTLSWRPGFNGGETQTFSVALRVVSPPEDKNGPLQFTEEDPWTLFLKDISDPLDENLVDVLVGPLKSSTHYVVRVTAANRFGLAVAEMDIKTSDPPEESLGTGAIVGIIILVLVILIILAAVIYLFIYKRICAKNKEEEDEDEETGETRKSMLPHRISTLLKLDKCTNKQEAGDSAEAVASEPVASEPKEGAWLKLKNLLKKNRLSKNSDSATEPSMENADGDLDKGEDDPGHGSNTSIFKPPVENDDVGHDKGEDDAGDGFNTPISKSPDKHVHFTQGTGQQGVNI